VKSYPPPRHNRKQASRKQASRKSDYKKYRATRKPNQSQARGNK